MQRRKAFAAAGAVAATATAAVIALGANLGLFGLTGDQSGPGRFKLVDGQTPITQVVDIPVPVTAAGSNVPAAPTPSRAPSAPSAPTVTESSSTPSVPHESEDDDGGREGEHEHDEDD